MTAPSSIVETGTHQDSRDGNFVATGIHDFIFPPPRIESLIAL
jgi:hypothetical protein